MLDTDVLIDLLKGNSSAVRFVNAIPLSRRATTDITLMELIDGARDLKELRLILSAAEAIFDKRFLPITERASHNARELFRRCRHRYGVGKYDAFIAAICIERNARLMTRNVKHFECLKGLRSKPRNIRPFFRDLTVLD